MKKIGLLLIACLYLTYHLPVHAQTGYKAALIVKKGKSVDSESVEIMLENDSVKISGKKKNFTAKLIPLAEIRSAEYAYSDRPRYTVATLSTLALGITALPLFATKTKKNWLTISTDKEALILQLQSSNYRMLLLEMRKRGIEVSDSGNRDEKDENQPKVKKSDESKDKKNTGKSNNK